MRICALFSCSPRGLSSWASSLQSALTAASGVGYSLKNSHSTGLAALPGQQLNHGERGREGKGRKEGGGIEEGRERGRKGGREEGREGGGKEEGGREGGRREEWS